MADNRQADFLMTTDSPWLVTGVEVSITLLDVSFPSNVHHILLSLSLSLSFSFLPWLWLLLSY
jgi:hypothetical protein